MSTNETTETTAEVTEPTDITTPTVETSNINTNDTTETLEVTEKPEYKPDYKLKVYDEEKELDDPFLKALIKDADSEKKVKEIAQKYLGFETVKTRHEKTKGEYHTYQEQTKPIVDYYNQASQLLQKKDLEGFVELVGIDKQEIYKLAVKLAEEEQLPREQQMYMQQQKQIQRDREYLANQNQTLMSQQQTQAAQFRTLEMGMQLQRPDVSPVAQAYEAKNGPNSFGELVRQIGLAHHANTNGREDLTAEQAVQKAMKMIGAFVQPTNVNGTPAPQQTQLIQQNGAPPIIPNVTGRGSSPVRKQVRSISDLKKKSEELSSS